MTEQKICPHCGTPLKFEEAENPFKQIPTGQKPDGFKKPEPEKAFGFWVEQCDCMNKIEAAQNAAAEAKKRAEKIGSLRVGYAAMGLSSRMIGKRFKNLKCEHLDAAKNYVDTFNRKRSNCLNFYGQNGNGKSTLAGVICKELWLRGYKVLFIVYADFLNKLESVYRKDKKETIDDAFGRFMSYDFIFFDDFGREKPTDKRLEWTFLIFDKLYAARRPFGVTMKPDSMARIKDLPELKAIFNRWTETMARYNFIGESFRRKK